MVKENGLVLPGEVIQNLGPGGYLVRIPEIGLDVKATVGGKMRHHRISILPGDTVDVEVSMYDTTQGRIIYRHSKDKPRPQTDNTTPSHPDSSQKAA